MKIFQTLIVGICIMSIPFFSSCGDDDPDPCDYALETQDELNDVVDAQEAWIADPTNTAKCNAYKAAWTEYLDDLENHADCVRDVDQAAYDQAIDDAQASINQLQC